MINTNIIAEGVVRKLYISKDGHAFFRVEDKLGKDIKGVLFKNYIEEDQKRLELLNSYNNKNDILKFSGKVDFYKGEIEIIVEDIKK